VMIAVRGLGLLTALGLIGFVASQRLGGRP
jgi:hypothetical protein